MIIITSARYVNPELETEFGKVPPSFLPVGGKKLYEYQSSLFKNVNDKIILTIPKSYELNKYDNLKLKELKINILRLDENLTLGQSLSQAICLNLTNTNLKKGLKILHGDTFFKNLNFLDNSIGVSRSNDNYNWTYLLKDTKPIFHIKNNQELNTKDILNGFFEVQNINYFLKCLIECDYDFKQTLLNYSKKYNFNLNTNQTWLDCGIATNYFNTKKTITTERAFNSLKIINGYVCKSSSMDNRIKAEQNWFGSLPKELSLYIPHFYLENNKYYTEYLYLNTLSELYVFGKINKITWERIFLSLKNFLTILHSHKTKEVVSYDYKFKTQQRLKEFSKEANFNINKNIIFNQKINTSINEIIKDIDSNLIEQKQNSFIHGDFCFSNILYDFKSASIKTIDPRGMDFKNNITPYGNSSYDYAKLFHSIIGLYDFIIAKHYKLKFKNTNDNYIIDFSLYKNKSIDEIQSKFLEIFQNTFNIKEIYIITIHLFLSMLPLHSDDLKKQYALLANAIRLYIEFKEL
ncbi:capsular biosynthesis protein [Campylobacter sp. 2018MI10]|uniref:capsular biosynthesis protein n=2 Tax=unclassified Campylobacter TaxID=2593542 RepID=UPI001BDA6AB0|nr:capsular biosynthesis protein [Campylobacter sp. 2018MI10]MBT0885597.1 capsular biosynthesis protein [Campylobacter sp. 2018MI10]